MEINIKKNVGIVIVSIFTILFLSINLENVHTIAECFGPFQITDILSLVVYYIMFSKVIDIILPS